MSVNIAGTTLNKEDYGQICDAKHPTQDLTQGDIVNSVDVQSAQKRFTLELRDFGPYTFDFSPNGRYLALAGRRGHVSTIDWQPKKLLSEYNVQERIHDICYFHNEQMYAVAQNKAVFVYDEHGVQIHSLDKIDAPCSLNFLPKHFLLVIGNQYSKLSYLDITLGVVVSRVNVARGPITIMASSKQNGIQHIASARGAVSLWCPSSNPKKPLVDILCHKAPITSLAVDDSGQYLATSSSDNRIRVWDLRTYGCLHEKQMPVSCSALAYSNTGILAAACRRNLITFKDSSEIYLKHRADGMINSLKFCPYEDVLGVSHSMGYESVLIPGSGEANIDTYEVNPYQTKGRRQTQEVKQLLDKIPWELISLNTDQLVLPRNPMQKNTEESELTIFSKKNNLRGLPAVEVFKREKMRQRRDEKVEAERKEYEELMDDMPYDALHRFRSKEDKRDYARKYKQDLEKKQTSKQEGEFNEGRKRAQTDASLTVAEKPKSEPPNVKVKSGPSTLKKRKSDEPYNPLDRFMNTISKK